MTPLFQGLKALTAAPVGVWWLPCYRSTPRLVVSGEMAIGHLAHVLCARYTIEGHHKDLLQTIERLGAHALQSTQTISVGGSHRDGLRWRKRTVRWC